MSVLLSRILEAVAGRLASGDEAAWEEAKRAFDAHREDDIDLFVAIDDKDLPALKAITAAWRSGKRPLPAHDRNLLKAALKAFRKRLKLANLDADSSLGKGPMSSGRHAGIVGVRAPDQYPAEVWEELVRQGRLKEGRDGTHELPPDERGEE